MRDQMFYVWVMFVALAAALPTRAEPPVRETVEDRFAESDIRDAAQEIDLMNRRGNSARFFFPVRVELKRAPSKPASESMWPKSCELAGVFLTTSCVGFYTDFDHNNVLAAIPNAASIFNVQAKHPDLSAKQGGFILFCDQSKMEINFLECYFYGDDTLPIAEILGKNHKFVVDSVVGFGSNHSPLGGDRTSAS